MRARLAIPGSLVAVMLLGACAPAPTAAPVATQAPMATQGLLDDIAGAIGQVGRSIGLGSTAEPIRPPAATPTDTGPTVTTPPSYPVKPIRRLGRKPSPVKPIRPIGKPMPPKAPVQAPPPVTQPGDNGGPPSQPPSWPDSGGSYPDRGYPDWDRYPKHGHGPKGSYPGKGYPYPGQGYPYPSTGYPYPGQGYPYPSTGYPYPGQGYPYPGTGYPYPSKGYPYPDYGHRYPDKTHHYPDHFPTQPRYPDYGQPPVIRDHRRPADPPGSHWGNYNPHYQTPDSWYGTGGQQPV